MKYLIVGLGNPGYEYDGTRHNIGFRVVDTLAKAAGVAWEDKRYGFVANMRVKNAQIVLLKPTTFMNLSGNAVRYWMEKENIAPENLLIVVDDLSLPTGTLRRRRTQRPEAHSPADRAKLCPTEVRHRQRVSPWRASGLRARQVRHRRRGHHREAATHSLRHHQELLPRRTHHHDESVQQKKVRN